EIRWSDSREAPPASARAIEPLLATGSHLPSVLAAACGEALGRVIAGEDDALGLELAQWAIDHGLAPLDGAGASEGAGGEGGAADLHALRAQFEQVAKDIPAPRRAFVMEDAEPEDEYVFIRGDHRQRGEVAPRTFLGALCAGSPLIESETGSGRLELARKLLDEANPLPARVIVNRVWLHMMGEGIVATPDDFGLLGRLPTHPELLDDLAWRFTREMGWSLKTLIREIALSSTYRMRSGTLSAEAARIDPDNELLSVRSPRRLQGEVLRDAMLAVSGRLDRTMYGKSVPIHLTDFMTGRGRPGRSGPLDGDGRRSIYLEVRRNFPVPMLSAFDTPVPHSTMGARLESNVPAQSLI